MKVIISSYTQEEFIQVQQLAIDIARKYDTDNVYIREVTNNDRKETQLYKVVKEYHIVVAD